MAVAGRLPDAPDEEVQFGAAAARDGGGRAPGPRRDAAEHTPDELLADGVVGYVVQAGPREEERGGRGGEDASVQGV